MSKCVCGGLGCKMCARQQTKAWHQNTKVKKVEYDGHVFDSGEEMEFYRDYLKTGQYRANIDIIELQPKYELLAKFEKMGKKHRAITYTPDFYIEFTDQDGNRYAEVIDVKGFTPRDFPLRRKLFDFQYPNIELIIVSKAPLKYGGGFMQLEQLEALRKAEKKAKGVAKGGQAESKTSARARLQAKKEARAKAKEETKQAKKSRGKSKTRRNV